MKKPMITALLAAALLAGCSAAPLIPETQAATYSSDVRASGHTDSLPPTVPAGAITREEAEAIALKHAGLTADQVQYLRTDYEIDDGVPQYEVQFHHERWEYDYEIHAETGAVLSFEKDD